MSSWIPPLQIPGLVQIYLVGFYDEREFALYVSSISNELRIPVRFVPCPVGCFRLGGSDRFQTFSWDASGFLGFRAVPLTVRQCVPDFRYLREDKPHGSAGGLYSFRDYIMDDCPVCPVASAQFKMWKMELLTVFFYLTLCSRT
jgi:mannose-1-phosphate guanylyltransferase